MVQMMRNVVQIQGGFKPSVQLPKDFFNEEYNRHFVESYIPTHDTLDIFMKIRDSLQMNSENRAKLFMGTYGTGKSDLMLMISNYITRSSDDPLLAPFFERLHNLNSSKAKAIQDARLHKPPFLLVLLQADTATTFSSFVLDGLEKALAQIGLSDIMDDTYYRAATDLIAQWERELPDNVERVDRWLQENYGMTLGQLKHDLMGPQADGALDIFRVVTNKIIGMPFHPTAVIERPDDAFNAVSKKLVESGKYSGVFIIADEFTHLLQKLAEPSTNAPNIKAIDNLAETASRSGKNQIHFYVVSLHGFSSAGNQANTLSSQTALERTGGRFIQGQISLRSQYMEELISAAIVKKVSPASLFEKDMQQQDELLSLAMSLWGQRSERHDREWMKKTIIQGCFPLHPLTAYCLPLLNNRLAQNERTMFSFLWDESRGLKSFIDTAHLRSDDGRLNLLSLDQLFAYFEGSLKEKNTELFYLYQQFSSKLTPEQIHTGLEGRLLRTLILLDMTTSSDSSSAPSNLRTTWELLRQALSLSPRQLTEFNTALKQLEQAGIAYPNQAGYYQLVKQGQANPSELRGRVEQYAKSIPFLPLSLLNERHPLTDIEATGYNKKHGTERKLIAKFVSVADLASPANLPKDLPQTDGLLWYVTASTEAERLQACTLAIQLTKTYDQLVIAILRSPTDIIERLKRKLAVEKLIKDSDYSQSSYQELLKESGLVGSDYYSAFNNELQRFGHYAEIEWYQQGRATTVQTQLQLEELATKIMEKVFPLTPTHSTRQHLSKAPRNTSKLKEALDSLISAPFRRPASTSRKSITEAILANGAEELGLIEYKDHEGGYNIYDVCVPDRSQSKAVWQYLDRQLQKQGISWSEIVEQLKCRPYGLYAPVIQLFLAAFLRLNRDYIEVYTIKNNHIGRSHYDQRIDVTGEVIIKMVDSPKDYLISYKPLPQQQKEFLMGLKDILTSSAEFSNYRDIETESLHNQVATFLHQRIKAIPILSQVPSLSELSSILPGIPEETIKIAITLIEIALQPDDRSRAASLLETLPLKIGLSANYTEWTSNTIQQALLLLKSAYHQLLQISKRLRQSIIMSLSQWFGLAEPTEIEQDVFKAANKWRKEKVGTVRTIDMENKSDARMLLHLLDNPYSFEQVFFNALPANWGLHPISQWQTLNTRRLFLERFEQAIQTIEHKAATQLRQSTGKDSGANERQVTNLTKSIAASQPEIVRVKSSTINNAPSYVSSSPIPEAKDPGAEQKQINIPVTSSPNNYQAQKNTNNKTEKDPSNIQQTFNENSIEDAFQTIRAIIDNLTPRNQRLLWTKLVEEYDPR
ncbi:hypothetical protein [Ktedonobacter racemifer]|uniref:Uncharacterized protein n=1 Tax=Ktedonobacter racemifer DSM 44963 TaxID=485913 RepID=D6TX55_KTERA|nr:hypothetical protein [Ktedonobacter racemifer]EFH84788.1 hypothetical protein Krac_5894 [Ktedonobacter racemifer DSM 44963]